MLQVPDGATQDIQESKGLGTHNFDYLTGHTTNVKNENVRAILEYLTGQHIITL